MKSLSTILQEVLSTANLLNTDLDIGTHSPFWDIAFSNSQEFYRYTIYNEYLRKMMSLDAMQSLLTDTAFKEFLSMSLGVKDDGSEYSLEDINDYISADIDLLAQNVDLTRKAATNSSGYIRFYFREFAAVTIEKSTQVQTSDETPIIFQTVEKVLDRTPTYDSDLGLYYVEVGASSIETGIINNVGIGSINVLTVSNASVVKVSNPAAFSGGKDKESDSDFIDRIKLGYTGRELATSYGLEKFLLEYTALSDVYVVSPPNSSLVRCSAGAVDAYVRNTKNLYQFIDTFAYAGSGEAYVDILLTHHPVDTISSVIYTPTAGLPTPITTYVLEKSYTSTYRNSTRANEYVRITGPPAGPGAIVVTYLYDYTFTIINSTLERPENEILALDLLVKRADEVAVNLNITLTLYGEYNTASGRDDFETRLNTGESSFFNGGVFDGERYNAKNISEDIDESDIVVMIGNMDEVDLIDLDNTSIEGILPDGTTRDPVTGRLVINDYEYAVLGTVTVTYTS